MSTNYDLEGLRKQYNELTAHKIFAMSMPLDSEMVACISLSVFKAILDALERISELEQELVEAQRESEHARQVMEMAQRRAEGLERERDALRRIVQHQNAERERIVAEAHANEERIEKLNEFRAGEAIDAELAKRRTGRTIIDLLVMHKAVSAQLDPTVENQNDFRFAAFGAIAEVIEALQHLPWRPWRVFDRREPTPKELEAALPELADAMGALLRCVVNLGIDPKRFEQACVEHIQTKFERINNGQDG